MILGLSRLFWQGKTWNLNDVFDEYIWRDRIPPATGVSKPDITVNYLYTQPRCNRLLNYCPYSETKYQLDLLFPA